MTERSKTLTLTLTIADSLRVNVVDGVPSLECFDTYAEAQEQSGDKAWLSVATGPDVASTLDELKRFAEQHSTVKPIRKE
jgi:hypothetical protein